MDYQEGVNVGVYCKMLLDGEKSTLHGVGKQSLNGVGKSIEHRYRLRRSRGRRIFIEDKM